MNKIIPIITSAPIQYSFNNLDIYEAFDLVSQGILEAPLTQDAADIIKKHLFPFPLESIKTIFTAEKGQTVATAKLLVDSGIIPNAKITPTHLLNGINFSMKSLIPKEKFITLSHDRALSFARKAFIEELYKNNLSESLENLILRMDNLLSFLQSNNESVLCISHAFYMKLLEIYTKDRTSFLRLETTIKSFHPSEKPYKPLSGFDLNI